MLGIRSAEAGGRVHGRRLGLPSSGKRGFRHLLYYDLPRSISQTLPVSGGSSRIVLSARVATTHVHIRIRHKVVCSQSYKKSRGVQAGKLG